jgi:cysteine sulfinate desulfinase/cysteine desulfurase-like protein
MAAELAMRSLEDGTIPRLAALRDRLEAGLLRLPGTGVNGANQPQMPGAPGLSAAADGTWESTHSADCHPERLLAERGGAEGSAVAVSNDSPAVSPDPCSLIPVPSHFVPRVANTTNIWFDNLEGEALVIALDLKGVAVSGGSACHSGATEPSHVLMAMGLDKTRARSSLRFSLLKTATAADIDYVLQVVPEAVEHLRALSPEVAGTRG